MSAGWLWREVGFGCPRRESVRARAGVELHGTVILGKLEAQKGVVDGYKVFFLENPNCRNFVLEEKKPEKKIKPLGAT